ncbi:MAG: peptide-methionine (S)-S-oxide reductase MsrA [Candidatus Tyrphobacter sp.]
MSDVATFAAGCFWGTEAAFRPVPGVLDVVVGYTGGATEHPTYEDVCGHRTGHAEAAQITFDPAQISYDRLLEIFWKMHDPTQRDRQGPDVGTQYRSAIFVHSPRQEEAARASLARAQSAHQAPIATEIVDAPAFWPAEAYHQRYFEHHNVACHTQ